MRLGKLDPRVIAVGIAAAAVAVAAVVWVSPATATATAQPATLSAADQTALVHAYAAYQNIPVSDIGGIQAGSTHAAVQPSTGVEWATATLTPGDTSPEAVQFRFQDGGSIGVFTRQGKSAWTMRAVGGEPFPCGDMVPSDVEAAWGMASPAACATADPEPAITQQTATKTVVSISMSQVGRGDTPRTTDFNRDCNPFTTLVHVGASTAGCGVDSHFKIRDENELWCADFTKWVWEQAGVKADLSVLNAGATSFATWGKDRKEHLAFDSGTPKVGDAIVFYPKGTPAPVGHLADHVGIIVGFNKAKGTVDMVNGDFGGASNITVQHSGYVKLQAWANSIWGNGEKWVLVAPGLPASALGASS